MKNELVCWMENGEKKWEMVKENDSRTLLLNLLMNKNVVKHSIFIIPCTGGFVSGLWLYPKTHKSSRVDFWNFHEDFGTPYVPPVMENETGKEILHNINERNSDNTKYGWISPDGKYYHCGYQGHAALAASICFGMYETNNPERCLEEHGWCKIYKSLTEEEYHVYVSEKFAITKAQFETLKELGLENARHIDRMLMPAAERKEIL